MEDFILALKEKGMWISRSGDTLARIVLYHGVTDEQVFRAAEMILAAEEELAADAEWKAK